MKITVLCSII